MLLTNFGGHFMDMWLQLSKSPNVSKLHLMSKMLKVFMITTHSQQTNKLEQLWKISTEAKNLHFEVKKTSNC